MEPVEILPSQKNFGIITKSKELFLHEFNKLIENQLKNRFYNPLFDSKEERLVLIEQVIFSIGNQLKIDQITLSLAICIFDAVISNIWMKPQRMEMVAFVSLQLAIKINSKNKLLVTSCLDVSKFNLLKIERIILILLKHDLNLKSPLHVAFKFLELESFRFEIKTQLDREDAICYFRKKVEDVHRVLSLGYDINSLTPGAVGTVIIMLTRKHFGFKNLIFKEMLELTQFKKGQILACFDLLKNLFHKCLKKQLENKVKHKQLPELIDNSNFDTFSFLSDTSTKKLSICF